MPARPRSQNEKRVIVRPLQSANGAYLPYTTDARTLGRALELVLNTYPSFRLFALWPGDADAGTIATMYVVLERKES